MKETVTIQVDTNEMDRTYLVTATIAESAFHIYKSDLLSSVVATLRDRIVEKWMDEHGSELMEELSPGLLKKLVADSIAKKVLS